MNREKTHESCSIGFSSALPSPTVEANFTSTFSNMQTFTLQILSLLAVNESVCCDRGSHRKLFGLANFPQVSGAEPNFEWAPMVPQYLASSRRFQQTAPLIMNQRKKSNNCYFLGIGEENKRAMAL